MFYECFAIFFYKCFTFISISRWAFHNVLQVFHNVLRVFHKVLSVHCFKSASQYSVFHDVLQVCDKVSQCVMSVSWVVQCVTSVLQYFSECFTYYEYFTKFTSVSQSITSVWWYFTSVSQCFVSVSQCFTCFTMLWESQDDWQLPRQQPQDCHDIDPVLNSVLTGVSSNSVPRWEFLDRLRIPTTVCLVLALMSTVHFLFYHVWSKQYRQSLLQWIITFPFCTCSVFSCTWALLNNDFEAGNKYNIVKAVSWKILWIL